MEKILLKYYCFLQIYYGMNNLSVIPEFNALSPQPKTRNKS